MALLPTYFDDFLREVRPTKNQRDDLRRGHSVLRERLMKDESLAPLIVSTFLQGSYRRSTVIRPKADRRSDVDIIVVTRISKDENDPGAAMGVFIPFLDAYYEGKWQLQGRSFGIELSYVEMDLVITAAPSESVAGILADKSVTSDASLEEARDWRLVAGWVPPEERTPFHENVLMRRTLEQAEWKTEPLWIPDREANQWSKTDPLAQIIWTRDKNGRCNAHYLRTVQALKWWRRGLGEPARPKGYPIEHLIGTCCPDGIASVAEGVVRTLENFVSSYASYAQTLTVPELPDHGVPEHNVMARVSGADFTAFYNKAAEAAIIAREAMDESDTRLSANRWRDLFGSKFPEPPEGSSKRGGFSERIGVSDPARATFA